MADLFIMEAANLYAGDHDPSASNHVALQTMKLPGIENNYVDHTPGGSALGIEVGTHINRMEATFNLAGWSPHVMVLIGSWTQSMRRFTARGVIRSRRTGQAQQAIAVMEGELGRVNPTDFRRADLHAHEYSIRAITAYRLEMAGVVLFDIDFYACRRVIGGIDLNAEENAILGLNAGAP